LSPDLDMDEVISYLQTTREMFMNEDLLSWWKEQPQNPKLQELARQIFAIPASNVASERSFSAAGLQFLRGVLLCL
jgi:hypothetical protein